ncbi:hypothetical protein BDV93DRAFT_526388 [Ceratobasidium sp. AG-I]|nr:hypothetical protein BDV93DRAFT_526388 [Ceratobasidium sp. AG-I]
MEESCCLPWQKEVSTRMSGYRECGWIVVEQARVGQYLVESLIFGIVVIEGCEIQASKSKMEKQVARSC